MACSCKKNSTNSVKTVKQVIKRVPTTDSSKPKESKKRIVRKISYRRPI